MFTINNLYIYIYIFFLWNKNLDFRQKRGEIFVSPYRSLKILAEKKNTLI